MPVAASVLYPCRDAVLMVMLLKVLRHELLFYAGMLQGRANMETLDKVGFRGVPVDEGLELHNLIDRVEGLQAR